ncbi:MAG: PEP-CTERM sorting domain-containing protein, partial [Phycisphaerae bacterium]
ASAYSSAQRGRLGTNLDPESTPPFFIPPSTKFGYSSLEDGETYWIVASTTYPGKLAWKLNSTGDRELMVSHPAPWRPWCVSDGYDTMPAFRVFATPVPEPTTLALLGLAALFATRRSRAN